MNDLSDHDWPGRCPDCGVNPGQSHHTNCPGWRPLRTVPTPSSLVSDPLSCQVAALAERAADLDHLCGQILATLLIPANEIHLPRKLIDMAEEWKKNLDLIRSR